MTMTSNTTPLHELYQTWGADFLEVAGRQLPLRVSGAGQEYQAARESLALADGGDRGLVQMRGADLIDFLQRTLSSDLSKLAPGGGQWSALLDGKGHWITDLLLFRLPDEDGEPEARGHERHRAHQCHHLLEHHEENPHEASPARWKARGAANIGFA